MCSICNSLTSSLSAKNFVVEVIPADLAVAPGRAPGWSYDGGLGFLDLDDRGGFGTNGMTSFTTDEAAVQLNRTGRSWSGALGTPATITYGFRSTDPGVTYNGGTQANPGAPEGFSRMNAVQIAAVELLLASWADVAGLTFQRVGAGTTGEGAYTDAATMLFANYAEDDSAGAFAYLAGNASTSNLAAGGDVWVNLFGATRLQQNGTPTYLAYGYQTLTHEIGHALGLSHPGDYNAGTGSPTYADATYYEDTRQYSVMSYWDEAFTGAEFFGRYASAPLLDDIAAAQRMYGANMTTRTGDTVYGFNSNAGRIWYDATQGGAAQAVIFSVWDAGGNDTLDFSGYAQAGVIDLRQGHFSSVGGLSGNVSIALGAVVEQAIGGSGADTIVGNAADNVLRGNGGADIIDGGAGQDTAVFSGVSGAYTITSSTETVGGVTYQVLLVTGADGSDRLYNIEFLQFSNGVIAVPAAAAAGIRLEGDRTDNTLTGTAYADRLFGAGGNDTLNGGAGDDVLISGRGTDVLNGGDGVDTADYSSFTGALTINLATGTTTKPAGEGGGTDTLTSIENVRGTAYSDTITGDGGANRIEGGGGMDILNGGGGADIIIAGAGVPTAPAAPDVVKAQGTANISIPTAVNIDANFDISADAGFINPTTVPHAKINATANGGGKEYYAFTVGWDVTATFDINGGSFDTVIEIFDANGNRIAINDDGGSDGTNSYLSHLFAQAGTYYIAVSLWISGSGAALVMGSPPAGGTYGLNISIPGHAVNGLTLTGSTLNGDDGDDVLHSGNGDDTINGGANTDTAVYTGVRSAYTITDLGGGSFRVTGPDGTGVDTLTGVERVQFSDQTITLGAPVGPNVVTGSAIGETLNGTAGVDHIYGLAGNDALNGFAGNDLLVGGEGADTMAGGLGDDVYEVTEAGDVVVENAGEGADTVFSHLNSYTLTSNVETLALAGAAVTGVGNALSNTLIGTAGDNILIGGAGADTMIGGGGNDIYEVTDAGDVVVENSGEGTDTVFSHLDGYTLASNVETLVLAGLARTGTGNSVDNTIIGNYLDNVIHTGGGNDTVDGGNGGDTVMFSGLRSAYTISDNGDGSISIVGGGSTVRLLSVERLQFSDQRVDLITSASQTGAGGADTLHGSDIEDTLSGGGGDDFLFGYGGADTIIGGSGTDLMAGGDGNDVYEVTEAGDTVVEYAGEGIDTIFSYVDGYMLPANVETLALAGSARTGVGNSSANTLIGTSGNDILIGGTGADTMIGGLGDDVYEVDDLGDIVMEVGPQAHLVGGTDTVFSYVDGYHLADYVEVLALVGSARTGYGNVLNNVMIGNALNNTLVGGAGSDTMIGGAGDDVYEVTEAGDIVVENGGEGTDTVFSYVNGYTLAANVEVLALAGSAVTGFGNSGANTLIGNAENNILNGNGGDDIYVGGAGIDQFWHLSGAGNDQIIDFNAAGGESIVLSSLQFANYAAVQAAMVQSGADVLITAGGGQTLRIVNMTIGQLSSGNFAFYGGPGASPQPSEKGLAPQVLPHIENNIDDPLILPVGVGLGGRDAFERPEVLPVDAAGSRKAYLDGGQDRPEVLPLDVDFLRIWNDEFGLSVFTRTSREMSDWDWII